MIQRAGTLMKAYPSYGEGIGGIYEEDKYYLFIRNTGFGYDSL